MIVPMTKVWLFGPKSLLNDLLALLQSKGVLHIRTSPEYLKGAYTLTLRVLNEDETRIRSLLEHLLDEIQRIHVSLPSPHVTAPQNPAFRRDNPALPALELYLSELSSLVEDVESRVHELVVRRKELHDTLETVRRYEKVIHALSPFAPHITGTNSLEFVGLTIRRKEDAILPYLREAVGNLTENRFELFTAIVDDETIACLIAFPKEHSAKVRGLLWEEGVTELHIPSDVANLPLGEALLKLIERERTMPEEIAGIDARLQAMSDRWYEELMQYRRYVEDLRDRLETSSCIYLTRMTFFISGWIPSDQMKEIRAEISAGFGEKVVVEEKEIWAEDMDEVPVCIRNPRLFRPFELFMRILPLPKYGTIDPTILIGVFFPIFFGMILGDVAYGLIILAGGVYIRARYRHHPLWRDAGSIACLASVYTIVFGVLYGEFFGALGEHFGLHPILFDRMTAIMPFLALALSVGVLHVTLGLVLGAVTAWGMKHRREAVAIGAKLGIIIAVIGIVAGAFVEEAAMLGPGSLVLFFVMLLVLLVTGGVLALLKVIEVMGNILSYARIMAIGLSSVILAYIANKLGGAMGNIVLGIFVAAIFHLLSLVLGIFSPTIHSIRLHYVEFFGKFFVPGGRPYMPFRTREV